MNEVVRKELREYGLPAVGVLLVLCAAWQFLGSAPSVLIQPRAEPSYLVIATGCVVGTLLGYAQFASERARGTLGYLVHREGGYRALFHGKARVGLALALALAVLPVLIFAAGQAFGEYAGVLQPARVFEHALAGLACCSAYATGVLVALLSRGVLAGAVFGLMGALGCMVLAFSLPLPVWKVSPLATPIYVGVELALAALLLVLARSLFVRAFDRDAVLSTRMQLACALLAVPLLVQPAWSCLWSVSGRAQLAIFREYPLLVGGGGQAFRLTDNESWRRLGPSIDLSAEPVIPPARGFEVLRPMPGWTLPREWTALAYEVRQPQGLSHPWRWEPVMWAAAQVFLDREQGLVRIIPDVPGGAAERVPPQALVLRRGGASGRFSPQTVVLASTEAGLLFVDLADKTLWTLESRDEGMRLAEVRLPQGDELVELRPVCDSLSARIGRLGQSSEDALLVGREGTYHWTRTGLRTPDAGWPHATALARELSGFEWRVRDVTASSLTVEVRKAGELAAYPQARIGDVVFEHTYEPASRTQHVLAALVRTGGAAAPPLSSALRLAGAEGLSWSVGSNPVYARMLADSDRFHAMHVLFGLALGALAWRRTARRGGTLPERVLWAAFVALFGVFALAFFLLLRPRPARARRASAGAKPAARLAAT